MRSNKKMMWVSWLTLVAVLAGLLPPGIAPVGAAPETAAARPAPAAAPPLAPNAADALGNLPLAFIPNQGQVDDQVAYTAQAGGHTMWFTAEGVTISFSPTETLRLEFVDANLAPQIEASEKLPGTVNYFRGNDPDGWQTGLPTYATITYRDLWPGIDLTYEGRAGALKSTFTVAPGADPAAIRLAYPDADALRVDADGSLVIEFGETELRESAPVAWQPPDESDVVALYDVTADARTYTFALPAGYDRAQTLVIDPELHYSIFLGGSSIDKGFGIAVDSAGCAYVTGYTNSSDFPTTPGAFDTTKNSNEDAFVIKLNADGTGLDYATFLGGSSYDYGYDIAVDSAGSVYFTGWTDSYDFPTTPGAFDTTTHNSSYDAFVVKLNVDGTGLDYATFLGGSSSDYSYSIDVDSTGNAYLTGVTYSSDFPTTPGAFDTTKNSNEDAFVIKLNADGTTLDYATFLGGSSDDHGRDIAVDSAGSVYVTGSTDSADFPITPNAFDTTHNSSSDAFVVKLNADDTGLDYATFLGGSSNELSIGIAVDSAGSAYVTGWTRSSDFPTTSNAFDTTYNGGNSDAFVIKLSADGTGLDYATFLGGSFEEDLFSIGDIALDGAGSVYVMGNTDSADFPITPNAFDTTHNGGRDVFMVKLNADDTGLDYATFLGGSSDEGDWFGMGGGIAVDSVGSVYITCNTSSSNFPTTPGDFDTTYNSSGDAFITHFALLSTMLTEGAEFINTGRTYRDNFHAELSGSASVTISDTLASYAESGYMYLDLAEQCYEGLLRWGEVPTHTEPALLGLLNTRWELATGAMLSGNEWMVKALDVVFESPGNPLLEEIDQLEEAIAWYTMATDGYTELLVSEHFTDLMTLQISRTHPINGSVTPYLDLQRLALASAKKSRAYLELAERQFRMFTPAYKVAAEATLREGIAVAMSELALLDSLWPGASDDFNYAVILRNLSDMQRIYRYLQEDKNPFGYSAEYVPFHFQPVNLPQNNFQQTLALAEDEVSLALFLVQQAEGKQQESDDNYVILQQRLADIQSQYDSQLVQLCGSNVQGEPDLQGCHENDAGQIYGQLLRIEAANLRIQSVEQQMANQLELIEIEQDRAARVAGVHRATAEMYTETGEKLADLASEEAKLRQSRTDAKSATDYVSGMFSGAASGAAFGSAAGPWGMAAGAIIGGLSAGINHFNSDNIANRSADLAAKRERLQAYQNAKVQYAQAEITDINSEALIKKYMLKFAEYDIELSIAMNNLQQELTRLNGLKTQVEYLASEKEKALNFTEALYQDPAGRVLRDYFMELADDRFDVALHYAYRAARALEYEINQDAAFENGPLTDLESLYRIRDIYTLQVALAQVEGAYTSFLARPDVPVPQPRETAVYLSLAMGFADTYDPDEGRIVTREEKFNQYIRDHAERDEDGNAVRLVLNFPTSIVQGNPFFSAGVFNNKILHLQGRVWGNNMGDDRVIAYVRQSGTSFIRTVDAYPDGDLTQDSLREYNIEPLIANVMLATNLNELSTNVATNYEFGSRSVAFTNWSLVIDKRLEPDNFDVDIDSIEEIQLDITHEGYTLQSIMPGTTTRTPSLLGVQMVEESTVQMSYVDPLAPPPLRVYEPVDWETIQEHDNDVR